MVVYVAIHPLTSVSFSLQACFRATECLHRLPLMSSSPVVRVAVAQMTSTSDWARNLDICSRLAADAARQGCRLLCLPECFAYMGES